MKRLGLLVLGLVAYAVFVLTFLYLVAFVVDLPAIARTIDRPVSGLPVAWAVVVDIGLIALFGVQHSVMARKSFKAAWTRIVPAPVERSVYMLFTCLALLVLFVFWQPVPGALWDVRESVAAPVFWSIAIAGWLLVFFSTWLIDHFELFGLAQVWSNWRGVQHAGSAFRQPLLYRLVRHPLLSGFIVAFWATPVMSWGHLLFAVAMTGYILIAIEYEERDLVAAFGGQYESYRKRVGKLLPRMR